MGATEQQDDGRDGSVNPVPTAQEGTQDEAESVQEQPLTAEQAECAQSEADTQAPTEPREERTPAAQVAVLQQQVMRLQADFDNFRRRTRQEREDWQTSAVRGVLVALLPVIDNFERALAAFTDAADAATLQTGVEMVHRQLTAVLEAHNVRAMTAVGEPFNPALHEAVLQQPAADGADVGIVVEELQRGYQLGDKVLRPAMVKVTV